MFSKPLHGYTGSFKRGHPSVGCCPPIREQFARDKIERSEEDKHGHGRAFLPKVIPFSEISKSRVFLFIYVHFFLYKQNRISLFKTVPSIRMFALKVSVGSLSFQRYPGHRYLFLFFFFSNFYHWMKHTPRYVYTAANPTSIVVARWVRIGSNVRRLKVTLNIRGTTETNFEHVYRATRWWFDDRNFNRRITREVFPGICPLTNFSWNSFPLIARCVREPRSNP